MQKGQTLIFVLAGILILIIVVTGAYYLGKSSTSKSSPTSAVTSQPTTVPTASLSATPDETANWKAYISSEYGYSIKYPTNIQPALQQDARVYQGIGGSVNIDEWSLLGQPSYTVAVFSYKTGVNSKLEFNLEGAPESTVTIAGQQVKRLDSKDGTLTHVGPIKNKDLNYMIIYTGNKSRLGLDIFKGMIATFKFLQ